MPSAKVLARSHARSALVQALYQWQLSHASAHDIEVFFFMQQEMKKVDREYFSELLKGIIKTATVLDELLAPLLDRKPAELTPVEHAILYLGTYELQQRVDVPYKVVINESVELAKDFGAEDSFKYVNGVLDKLSYKLRKAERLPS